jgi:hypothetical protein
MIKVKDLVNAKETCFGCKCNTYEGQDVYSVSLASISGGVDSIKVVHAPFTSMRLKVFFCKSCWQEMAGDYYSFDEVETQAGLFVPANGLYGVGNGANIPGTWHHAIAGAGLPVLSSATGPIGPPLNPLGNTLPLSPMKLNPCGEEKIDRYRDFDKTDALICASLASMALVIGFVIFKVGCFVASFL